MFGFGLGAVKVMSDNMQVLDQGVPPLLSSGSSVTEYTLDDRSGWPQQTPAARMTRTRDEWLHYATDVLLSQPLTLPSSPQTRVPAEHIEILPLLDVNTSSTLDHSTLAAMNYCIDEDEDMSPSPDGAEDNFEDVQGLKDPCCVGCPPEFIQTVETEDDNLITEQAGQHFTTLAQLYGHSLDQLEEDPSPSDKSLTTDRTQF